MALTRAGICRYTCNGTYLGAPVATIVDMLVNPVVAGPGRDEQVADIAEVVLDRWANRLMPLMKGQYSFNSVSWVDLNTVSGSTGEITSTDATTLPVLGEIGGAPYSGAVAILVDKNTVARRGQKSGRMFLPPCGEADIEGNTIGTPYLNALQAALNSLYEGLTVATAPSAGPVVVHSGLNVEGPGWSAITGYRARSKVTTQRRRLGKGA